MWFHQKSLRQRIEVGRTLKPPPVTSSPNNSIKSDSSLLWWIETPPDQTTDSLPINRYPVGPLIATAAWRASPRGRRQARGRGGLCASARVRAGMFEDDSDGRCANVPLLANIIKPVVIRGGVPPADAAEVPVHFFSATPWERVRFCYQTLRLSVAFLAGIVAIWRW